MTPQFYHASGTPEPKATSGGQLTLTWTREPGLGGNGRGCQVSEVWLIKE